MEYNTTREKLTLPEYGRNIQKMIEFICPQEDTELRNKLAKAIISVMAQFSPSSRESLEAKQKLWDHLFVISNFKLDVDSPYPKPEVEKIFSKPRIIPYSQADVKYRQYGKNLEGIIKKVIEYEDGPEKEKLISLIANQLKKAYLNWNRDSVNDELISNHFDELSNGQLKLQEDFRFHNTYDLLGKNRNKKKFIPRSNMNGMNKPKKKL